MATRKSCKKWSQKFKEDYSDEWPCITRSSKGIYHAFCKICNDSISVEHGGRDDIRRHVATKRHCEIANARSGNTMFSYFRKPSEEEDAMKAELLFTGFLIEHNIQIAASDHAGSLFRVMFPDSQIAKKYGCGRTKDYCYNWWVGQ